jgi:hypothetical protein
MYMTRFITSLAVALSFAGAVALNAQDATIKTQTKVKADNAKTMTYTGCVGVEATSTLPERYVLNNVVPVGRTTRTEVGTSGVVTTNTTTYMLIPGEPIEFHPHIGHKVEITGMLMSGDTKTQTKTTINREGAKDTTIKDTTKTDDAMPQLRVISVKHLADSCTM